MGEWCSTGTGRRQPKKVVYNVVNLPNLNMLPELMLKELYQILRTKFSFNGL